MNTSIEKEKQRIIEQVESKLPDFAEMIKKNNGEAIVLHQDAFAADYNEEELLLLGMAVKYAGMNAKRELTILGKNRETLEPVKLEANG